jgi:translation initiation factor 1
MSKKNKKRIDIVYSTNQNYDYQQNDDKQMDTLPNDEQELKICIDKKQRKGKSVTIIYGFEGQENDLKDLAKLLKSKCGVGGTVKNDEILIQGEFKEKIFQLLIQDGYSKTKKVGG